MKPVTIAGGGIAGAACAIRLARSGQRVVLHERLAKPGHKVCGEFVSHEARASLSALGIDLEALGAQSITHLRLARGGHVATLALPFTGSSITRRRLDEALLAEASASGAEVRRGAVFRLERSADPLFLATGKHDTRGVPRERDGTADDLVGYKTYFRLDPEQRAALAGHVELHLFRDGYAGLQLVEDDLANLCLLVGSARLSWPSLLARLQAESRLLATRLTGAVEQLERPLAIARMPFGYVHRPHADDPPHLYRLGDQAAVIQALTGDGMSVALHSAARATQIYLRGGTALEYHRQLRRDVAGQVARASVLYRAGCHPAGQRAFMTIAAIQPGAIRLIARMTRVSKASQRAALAD